MRGDDLWYYDMKEPHPEFFQVRKDSKGVNLAYNPSYNPSMVKSVIPKNEY